MSWKDWDTFLDVLVFFFKFFTTFSDLQLYEVSNYGDMTDHQLHNPLLKARCHNFVSYKIIHSSKK